MIAPPLSLSYFLWLIVTRSVNSLIRLFTNLSFKDEKHLKRHGRYKLVLIQDTSLNFTLFLRLKNFRRKFIRRQQNKIGIVSLLRSWKPDEVRHAYYTSICLIIYGVSLSDMTSCSGDAWSPKSMEFRLVNKGLGCEIAKWAELW
ncbi:hypothetical protein BC833DRAFT_629649 [Globomyces pollinis-pini]|nr:hypothetical protein BC833DRAFT_629649 [Globomyces pollinis-pini]